MQSRSGDNFTIKDFKKNKIKNIFNFPEYPHNETSFWLSRSNHSGIQARIKSPVFKNDNQLRPESQELDLENEGPQILYKIEEEKHGPEETVKTKKIPLSLSTRTKRSLKIRLVGAAKEKNPTKKHPYRQSRQKWSKRRYYVRNKNTQRFRNTKIKRLQNPMASPALLALFPELAEKAK